MLKKIFTPKAKGFLISNLVGLAIVGITKILMAQNSEPVIIFSEFIIVPVLMGMVGGWFWQDLQLRSRKLALYSCLNSFLCIALSFIFLGEGVICLIIVSPLIFCFMLTGAFIGRNIYKRNNDTLNVSVVFLLIAIFVLDAFQSMIMKTR